MKNTSFFKQIFIASTLFAALLLSCNKKNSTPTNTYTLSGTASGSQETTANASGGTATLTGSYNADNNTLQYSVTYNGLTGAVTAAHIHGPALAGANASVLIPFTVSASPITGSAVIADSVETFLLAGKLYFNLHTATYPGGEVRGQVTATHN